MSNEKKRWGRWYAAVGGLGLEVIDMDRDPSDEDAWHTVGYIRKRHGWYEIRVNPYQDEGYTQSSHRTFGEAKAEFLRSMNATERVVAPCA